jgi:cell fate regulator YaaT (PSP1 superfamily)
MGEPVNYHLPEGADAAPGDTVILNEEDGLTYAITTGPAFAPPAQISCCQRVRGTILRRASDNDLKSVSNLRERESEAKLYCQQRAGELDLNMRITDMQGNLSGNNLTCFFVADRRVDFRQLVRDMGGRFRCHVLMRQVPAREQARRICGVGPCGRTLCCGSFMDKPRGVSSQDARAAAPGVSHSKLTGACGKLMCCLGYEVENGPALVQGP